MKFQKGFTVVERAVAIGVTVAIGAVITGICVAVHFIVKFW